MPIFTDSFWKMRRSGRAVSRFTISRNACDVAPKSAWRPGHDGERTARDRDQDKVAGAAQIADQIGAAASRAGLSHCLPRAAFADPVGLQRLTQSQGGD